ncbi:MAG: cytochrome c oxidase assembly protein [bacterium]
MDPVTLAVLQSWEWRVEIIIPLLLAGVIYFRGWRRLRHVGRRPSRLANGWRLAAYWSALLLVALALMSPIDVLASQFFFMHMIQHLMLIMLAAPLLMLADPMPFLLWGLPTGARRGVGRFLSRLLHRKSSSRRYLRAATGPGVVWMAFVFFLLGWHDPGAYDAALRNDFIHDVEHFTFFAPAVLYWWHVVGAAPHIHKRFSRAAQILYVIAAIPPNMLTGIAIAFAGQPIYTYYLGVPRVWGIDVLGDQTLGGVIMWVPGSMMYIMAILILTARWLQGEERKPPLPASRWMTDERMAAPGLKRR